MRTVSAAFNALSKDFWIRRHTNLVPGPFPKLVLTAVRCGRQLLRKHDLSIIRSTCEDSLFFTGVFEDALDFV